MDITPTSKGIITHNLGLRCFNINLNKVPNMNYFHASLDSELCKNLLSCSVALYAFCLYMSRLVDLLIKNNTLSCSLESPDPMFTMENVIREIQKVAVDNRKLLWVNVLEHERVVAEIYDSHSSDEEKVCSFSDLYVNCKPDSSWEQLVCCLYENGEMEATEIAKAFLPPKGKQNN